MSYLQREQREIERYRKSIKLHDLPKSTQYITNRYLKKLLWQITGFTDYKVFFTSEIKKYAAQTNDTVRIASIGAGNCDQENHLTRMVDLGSKVVFDCYELNPAMIERGQENAKKAGIEMRFFQQNFNQIDFQERYDGFFAHHALHHVENLEGLFGAIAESGKPGYFFLINDMIGRNGHMAWPKSYSFITSLWDSLPERLKWNAYLQRLDLKLPNYDQSGGGTSFEGIRTQDILPLLNKNFQFEYFIPFYSFINFINNRWFGHNYNVDPEEPNNDIALLEHFWYLDELFLQSKYLPPTQMFAKIVDPKLKGVELKTRIYKSVSEAEYQHYL